MPHKKSGKPTVRQNEPDYSMVEGIRIRSLKNVFEGGASGPHGPRPAIVAHETTKRKEINRILQEKRERRRLK